MDSLRDLQPLSLLPGYSHAEFEALPIELFGTVAAFKEMNSEPREEIAVLTGPKDGPFIRTSSMDRGTELVEGGQV